MALGGILGNTLIVVLLTLLPAVAFLFVVLFTRIPVVHDPDVIFVAFPVNKVLLIGTIASTAAPYLLGINLSPSSLTFRFLTKLIIVFRNVSMDEMVTHCRLNSRLSLSS
jgi:hypothetical protein